MNFKIEPRGTGWTTEDLARVINDALHGGHSGIFLRESNGPVSYQLGEGNNVLLFEEGDRWVLSFRYVPHESVVPFLTFRLNLREQEGDDA